MTAYYGTAAQVIATLLVVVALEVRRQHAVNEATSARRLTRARTGDPKESSLVAVPSDAVATMRAYGLV
jgi:hypothetical protein